jgi:uncharacterized protein YndB with AHSA1/START domain
MAKNEIDVDVPPERVFEVLSDPDSYGHWVVGSATVRDADDRWPAPGSRLHHRVGIGPIGINDHTEVLACQPPERLQLHARARPLGTAIVTLHIRPGATGSHVVMTEEAGDPLSRIGINRATQWALHLRNAESLRRLKKIAERR